ncbi:MAG: DUF2971 domain-containing protein [Limnobacter sp.]|uniref:DUF2971 domain-containing protein n=1 Tax=Limnobacter sp. TaxID=2003368 RepID=UPI0040375FB6
MGFNDPYDCALVPNIQAPNDQETEVLRQRYLANDDLTTAQRQEFLTKSTQELREIFLRAAYGAIQQSTQEFLKCRGVTCFSEKNDDLLMWSHYGGRYKGVCLEFNTAIEPFEKVKPVRYLPDLPKVDVSSILLRNNFDSVAELYCTKSSSWSYEREWRALHSTAGTSYVYPSEALIGVYFGPDIDGQSLEIVCLILAGQNEGVRFYKGSRSSTEFRVLFSEFTYTSYLQAKKLGLRK